MDVAARARDVDELVKLAAQATIDWERHTGKLKPSQHSDPEAAVAELLRDYEGMPSHEVAWRLGGTVTEKWVRRQRTINERDPDTGHERPAIPERTREVFRLYREGKKQAEIASLLGFSSQGRISQILNGTR